MTSKAKAGRGRGQVDKQVYRTNLSTRQVRRTKVEDRCNKCRKVEIEDRQVGQR